MLSELNLPCPYRVFQNKQSNFFAYYEFTSDEGVSYYVHFDEDDNLTEEYGTSGLYMFSFGHKGTKPQYDSKVKETIAGVLVHFFSVVENVVVYLCDGADGRPGARARLFSLWHSEYSEELNTVKFDEIVESEGEVFHTAIILRKDHPQLEKYVKAFTCFHEGLRKITDQSE